MFLFILFVQWETEEQHKEAVHSQGLPGLDKVLKVAEALINMEGLFAQDEVLKRLYDNHLDYNKVPLKCPAIYQKDSTRDQFARKYHSAHVGVETMKR